MLNFSYTTDTEPTDQELRMLVATKVADFRDLGTMLGMEYTQIEMLITSEEKKTKSINMEILTTWKKSATKMPTTWRTLLQALRDIKEQRLARDITNKLELRALGKLYSCFIIPNTLLCLHSIFITCSHIILCICL